MSAQLGKPLLLPVTSTDTPTPSTGQTARRGHILDAAEACFVRQGFHRTTMQDLAVEATMSQGNIYRYFSSKEEIVLACAARQRDAAAAEIAAMAETHDELEIIFHVIERFFVNATVERAVLAVDLWSEVRRIPTLRALSDAQETGFRDWFLHTVQRFAAPGCDVAALCLDVTTFMKGALLSRAVLPDHDSQALMSRLRALVGERLALAPPRGKPV